MSNSLARLLGLALLAVLAGGTPVRAQDYFDQKKKELALEAQQIVSDATKALETSRDLEKTDAAAAKALLEKRLREVQDSSSLDDKQRNDLRKRLLDRIRDVNGTLSVQRSATDAQSKLAADKAAREERDRMEKAKAEGQGKSVYDQSKDRVDSTKKTVDTYGDLKYLTKKGVTDMGLEDAKTFAKMKEEPYTKRFADITEKRKEKLSKEEVALLKALNSTISIDVKDATLKEMLELIDTKTGGDLNIFIDEASKKEAGVDYDSKVTFKGKNVKMRTLLKKMFGDLGLTWAIKDAAVQVITPDRMKDYMVIRAYPVQDLVTPIANNRMPPLAQKAYMYQQAQQLIQTIVNMIEPSSWQGMSEKGFGTITYNEAQGAIIVNHTAEMHYMLRGALSR
jgi:hypothetical protein